LNGWFYACIHKRREREIPFIKCVLYYALIVYRLFMDKSSKREIHCKWRSRERWRDSILIDAILAFMDGFKLGIEIKESSSWIDSIIAGSEMDGWMDGFLV
jgi:hypothetical protein